MEMDESSQDILAFPQGVWEPWGGSIERGEDCRL